MDIYYQGDYGQLILDPNNGDYAYFFWGATVDDNVGNYDQDVWFQVLPLPEPSEIFWNGFETGDTEVWDIAVGGS